RSVPSERARLRRFLVFWIASFILFFSLSAGKRKVYLLPCYPAVGLLVGEWAVRRAARGAATAEWLLRRTLAPALGAAFLWSAILLPLADRASQTASSYLGFARAVGEKRPPGEAIYAVGVASYFPLTIYLTPPLELLPSVGEVPPTVRLLIVPGELVSAS